MHSGSGNGSVRARVFPLKNNAPLSSGGNPESALEVDELLRSFLGRTRTPHHGAAPFGLDLPIGNWGVEVSDELFSLKGGRMSLVCLQSKQERWALLHNTHTSVSMAVNATLVGLGKPKGALEI